MTSSKASTLGGLSAFTTETTAAMKMSCWRMSLTSSGSCFVASTRAVTRESRELVNTPFYECFFLRNQPANKARVSFLHAPDCGEDANEPEYLIWEETLFQKRLTHTVKASPSANPLIFSASTLMSPTTNASASTWDSRPTWS